jgi:two-component system, chemotaxis family, CheB/CheR fusion protein
VLISVTSFFRDPQAFELLRVQLETMVEETGRDSVLRVWVPACATGEEAYGIAMLMSEIIREKGVRSDFLIFATDLDTDALAFARNGNYPDTAVDALPKPIRERYFEQTGRTYQVKKSLRQNMVFAVQNVIEDPPFSRVDLISCRNLLIYFNRDVQRRVLEIFHYALRTNGRLFLGKSESIELHKELFSDLDKKARIYLRTETTGPSYAVPLRSKRGAGQQDEPTRRGPEFPNTNYKLLSALAERYCPPAVVINELDEALHFVGELRPFLRFPRGSADLKVFDLVPDEMRGEIRALVHRCRRERQTQTGTVLVLPQMPGSEGAQSFVPVVTPIPLDKQLLLALSFEPAEKPLHAAAAHASGDSQDNVIIEELEKELASTRQHLQTVVEELETSNEELMSQSEELQSANEELQSTNEELQTSNEELQSTNEELLTVNDEMQSKSLELSRLAGDLQSVKESLDFPMLVTDERMHLKHFNRSADLTLPREGLQLDISLASIDWHIDMMALLPTVKTVIRTGKPSEVVVSDDQGRTFTVRAMPTTAADGESHGAVITFLDISTRAAAEVALRDREAMYRLSFEMSPVPMGVLKRNLQFVKANAALCKLLGMSEREVLKNTLTEVIHDPGSREWRMKLDELAHSERTSLMHELSLSSGSAEGCRVFFVASLAQGGVPNAVAQINVQLMPLNADGHMTVYR